MVDDAAAWNFVGAIYEVAALLAALRALACGSLRMTISWIPLLGFFCHFLVLLSSSSQPPLMLAPILSHSLPSLSTYSALEVMVSRECNGIANFFAEAAAVDAGRQFARHCDYGSVVDFLDAVNTRVNKFKALLMLIYI